MPKSKWPGEVVEMPSDVWPGEVVSGASASRKSLTYPGGEGMLGGNIRSPRDTMAEDIAGGIATAVKEGGLPTAGGALGARLGAATPFGIGILPGEALGSMAGEGVNQLTGITEPSIKNLLIEGASGPVFRGVTELGVRGLKGIAKMLPGAGAGLQEGAISMARELPEKFRPEVSSEVLFRGVAQAGNPRIDLPNTRKALDSLLKIEGLADPALRTELETVAGSVRGTIRRDAKVLKPTGIEGVSVLKGRENSLPFDEFEVNRRRIAALTGRIKGTPSDEVKGGFSRLTDAIYEDLSKAAASETAGPAASALKQGLASYRREKAVEKLSEVIEGAVNKGGVSDTFSPQRVLNQFKEVRKTRIFRESFSEAEQKEIGDLMNMIRALPKPGAARGVDAGSKQIAGRLAIGGATGAVLSGAGLASGAGATAIGGAYVLTSMAIAKAMTTRPGRAVLREALRDSAGVINRNVAARVGNFLAAQDPVRREMDAFLQRMRPENPAGTGLTAR